MAKRTYLDPCEQQILGYLRKFQIPAEAVALTERPKEVVEVLSVSTNHR